MKVYRSIIFIIICFILYPVSAFAHRVGVFAWVEGDKVFTESYSNRGKVVGARILVYDMEGKKILEGKTDKEGVFVFKNPQKGNLKIVLDASMGHRAEYILKVKEEKKGKSASISSSEISNTQDIKMANMDKIMDMLSNMLDQKLSPLFRQIAELKEKRGVTIHDIIGGIGYIVGLMGLALYLKGSKAGRPLKK
ncbi:MAG TPA: hypothetical protein ENF54_01375 [Desulfobacteraceae bacterium]|nr:hypothetical protein [Desulfobacteraceae bacterium]